MPENRHPIDDYLSQLDSEIESGGQGGQTGHPGQGGQAPPPQRDAYYESSARADDAMMRAATPEARHRAVRMQDLISKNRMDAGEDYPETIGQGAGIFARNAMRPITHAANVPYRAGSALYKLAAGDDERGRMGGAGHELYKMGGDLPWYEDKDVQGVYKQDDATPYVNEVARGGRMAGEGLLAAGVGSSIKAPVNYGKEGWGAAKTLGSQMKYGIKTGGLAGFLGGEGWGGRQRDATMYGVTGAALPVAGRVAGAGGRMVANSRVGEAIGGTKAGQAAAGGVRTVGKKVKEFGAWTGRGFRKAPAPAAPPPVETPRYTPTRREVAGPLTEEDRIMNQQMDQADIRREARRAGGSPGGIERRGVLDLVPDLAAENARLKTEWGYPSDRSFTPREHEKIDAMHQRIQYERNNPTLPGMPRPRRRVSDTSEPLPDHRIANDDQGRLFERRNPNATSDKIAKFRAEERAKRLAAEAAAAKPPAPPAPKPRPPRPPRPRKPTTASEFEGEVEYADIADEVARLNRRHDPRRGLRPVTRPRKPSTPPRVEKPPKGVLREGQPVEMNTKFDPGEIRTGNSPTASELREQMRNEAIHGTGGSTPPITVAPTREIRTGPQGKPPITRVPSAAAAGHEPPPGLNKNQTLLWKVGRGEIRVEELPAGLRTRLADGELGAEDEEILAMARGIGRLERAPKPSKPGAGRGQRPGISAGAYGASRADMPTTQMGARQVTKVGPAMPGERNRGTLTKPTTMVPGDTPKKGPVRTRGWVRKPLADPDAEQEMIEKIKKGVWEAKRNPKVDFPILGVHVKGVKKPHYYNQDELDALRDYWQKNGLPPNIKVPEHWKAAPKPEHVPGTAPHVEQESPSEVRRGVEADARIARTSKGNPQKIRTAEEAAAYEKLHPTKPVRK